YPRPGGGLLAIREEKNPFPEQLQALETINAGLRGSTYFIDTLPNPWHIAESLSSRAQVLALKEEQPQRLLDVLELIARSEANHARLGVATGASGIFSGFPIFNREYSHLPSTPASVSHLTRWCWRRCALHLSTQCISIPIMHSAIILTYNLPPVP